MNANPNQGNILRLVAAMFDQSVVAFLYTDSDGVKSIRRARVLSIEQCANKHVVVRAYDQQRNAPRSFHLARIEMVTHGSADAMITLI